MQTDLIICACGSSEHQVIVHHDKEDAEVYLSIFLRTRSFLGRIIPGLKYIFGYKCRYGHFDEIILYKEHIDSFKKIVETLEEK